MQEEQKFYDAVYETVHKALTTREMIQTVPFGKEEPIKKAAACGKTGGCTGAI